VLPWQHHRHYTFSYRRQWLCGSTLQQGAGRVLLADTVYYYYYYFFDLLLLLLFVVVVVVLLLLL